MATYPTDPYACRWGCDDVAVEGGRCVVCARRWWG